MPKENLIGLISAVPFEAGILIREMHNKKRLSSSIVSGRIGQKNVVHMSSGMGVANAAHTATVLCERFSPARIVVFGIGGAYPGSGLRIGDVAIAEKEVYADTGVLLKNGLHGVDTIGIELLKKGRKKFFNEFPVDSRLIKKALRELHGIESGIFATVNATTGTLKRARDIRNRFGAICENMEGAAVAHVCARYGIPMLELRGISNIIPKRDGWERERAAENSQKALLKVLPLL